MASGAAREAFLMVRPERPALAAAGVLGVISSALELARPWPLMIAIDYGIDHQRAAGLLGPLHGLPARSVLLIAVGLSVGLTLVVASVDYLTVVLSERAAERVGARLRQSTFEQMMNLSIDYHDANRSGELASRLSTDVGRILDALVAAVTTLLPNACLVAGMIAVLVAIDPTLALVSLAALPLLCWLAIQQREKVRTSQQRARTEAGRRAATATDLLRNVRAIQAFNRQRLVASMFERRNRAALDAEIEAITIEARWTPRADLLLSATSGMVLIVGAERVIAGTMSTGTLLVVVSYVSGLYRPVRSLARLTTTFAKASASVTRVREVLDSTQRVAEAPGASGPALEGSVRFENVAFAYAPGRWVLNGFDLSVDVGETVCLWGPSGAGKSTLLHLLLRLYDVERGMVMVDGIDVRTMTLAALRRQIGLVPQDPWLLDGTIAENIAFGGELVSRQAVLDAGRLAGVGAFAASIPGGYDAPVGEAGCLLSGGQRRRVAIARAIVTRAPLLLLDEPTASLDEAAAEAVVEAIRATGEQRTSIIVSHDRRIADLADRVITLSPQSALPSPGRTRALGRR